MIIKKVNPAVVDVFWDHGWESWARMSMAQNGIWKLSGGKPMPKKVFSEFRNRMSRNRRKQNEHTK